MLPRLLAATASPLAPRPPSAPPATAVAVEQPANEDDDEDNVEEEEGKGATTAAAETAESGSVLSESANGAAARPQGELPKEMVCGVIDPGEDEEDEEAAGESEVPLGDEEAAEEDWARRRVVRS